MDTLTTTALKLGFCIAAPKMASAAYGKSALYSVAMPMLTEASKEGMIGQSTAEFLVCASKAVSPGILSMLFGEGKSFAAELANKVLSFFAPDFSKLGGLDLPSDIGLAADMADTATQNLELFEMQMDYIN